MTSGLSRRYLRSASASQGWVICPGRAWPSPVCWWFARRHAADPTQNRSKRKGKSGDLWGPVYSRLLVTSHQAAAAGGGPDRCRAGASAPSCQPVVILGQSPDFCKVLKAPASNPKSSGAGKKCVQRPRCVQEAGWWSWASGILWQLQQLIRRENKLRKVIVAADFLCCEGR